MKDKKLIKMTFLCRNIH